MIFLFCRIIFLQDYNLMVSLSNKLLAGYRKKHFIDFDPF